MTRLRRSEFFVALTMLVGGALPGVLIYLWVSRSVWGAVIGGVLFWPCAFSAGALIVERA